MSGILEDAENAEDAEDDIWFRAKKKTWKIWQDDIVVSALNSSNTTNEDHQDDRTMIETCCSK